MKKVVENRPIRKGVKDLVERTTSIHPIDQDKIGDTFRDQILKRSVHK